MGKHTPRIWNGLHWAVAVVAALGLAACGGGGGGVGGSGAVPVKLRLDWGARSRAISVPSSALSAVLTLQGASTTSGNFTETHNRQVGLAAYTDVWTTLGSAKVGRWPMTLQFFAEPDGQGAVVGLAQADVTIHSDGSGIGMVATAGAVATVQVVPTQNVDIGDTKELMFSASDAAGNILAVTPGSAFWTSLDTARLQFVGGKARGNSPGDALVTVAVDGKVSPQQTVIVGSGTITGGPNYIHLQSDPGDWIGAGGNYSYTQADALITVTAAGHLLTVRVQGDDNWDGEFQVGSGHNQLEVGTYANIQRYPFNDPAVGGMDWFGNGRGSNSLTGFFIIDSVNYTNGVLDAIDLHFELHSEGMAPALRGQIHWTAYDTTKPPGPVNPPPAGLWQPPPGVTPPTGDYIYLESEPGDWIGQGGVYLFTPATSPITVTALGGHLNVAIAGNDWWYGDFQSMDSWLHPGYYGGLMRAAFSNPTKGGLEWFGEGRGSNTLKGWFVIDSSTYSGVDLTDIDLRFEQHSEGAAPALHGEIHWHLSGRAANRTPSAAALPPVQRRGSAPDHYARPVERWGKLVRTIADR